MAELKNQEDKTSCFVCHGKIKSTLSESNIRFLEMRIADGNLNEAIELARIAWDQFPGLKESSDAKRMLELVLDGMQEKMNVQVLVPISNSTAAMTAIIGRLENLAESNPLLIKEGFTRTLEGVKTEMNSIKAAIQEPTAKISQLNEMVHQLMYRPISKGSAGEAVLADLWAENFTKDQIEMLGGAGREDLVVRPYLGDSSKRFGDTISIERKTGKQKCTGSHREEAIRHAREKGAAVTMIIYDSPDNLPQSIRPVSITREQEILVVISDMQSGSWKMMRETIEIIMRVMHNSGIDLEAINIDAVQEVVTELGNMIKLLDQIKGSSVKIKGCADEVEQNVITIKALVKGYQAKLQIAIEGNDEAETGQTTPTPGISGHE